jgi:L-lactate dehydrogenase complex protein LldG
MTAREQILDSVRAALGSGPDRHRAAPAVRISVPERTPDARIEMFFSAISNLAGKPYQATSPTDACRHVAGILDGQPAVASNAPFLRECGITGLASVQTGFSDRGALRQACATAAAGITCAHYALADTGTLVMLASPEEARLISLLPPSHIAVVPQARIITGLDELFSLVPQPGELTSSMVLITGPSRTADIEQILVRGVHGPGEIHIVVV